MNTLFDIVAGWTGILPPFTLKIDGQPTDLTGLTVEIVLRNGSGSVTPGGVVNIDPDQVTHKGQVTYTPIETDFVYLALGPKGRQSYLIHWKVTDGANEVVYFPNGEPDEIGVYQP